MTQVYEPDKDCMLKSLGVRTCNDLSYAIYLLAYARRKQLYIDVASSLGQAYAHRSTINQEQERIVGAEKMKPLFLVWCE